MSSGAALARLSLAFVLAAAGCAPGGEGEGADQKGRSGPAGADEEESTAGSRSARAHSSDPLPVTDELLRRGHSGDPTHWPTYGGDYANTRFSPLAEIDTLSVGRLRPAWIHQTGIVGTFENTPVVIGREMYVATPMDRGVQKVYRLDAGTGEVVWEVTLRRDEPAAGAGREEGLGAGPGERRADGARADDDAHREDLHLPESFGPHRGVAVYGERVYLGTLRGTLLALERRSGEVAWEVATGAPRLSGAPLAADGKIVIGLSWLDRGQVRAFDAETGAALWTWHTIPSPEEGGWWGEWTETLPGIPEIGLGREIARERADSARLAERWRRGGGSAPMTPAFDPALGLLFVSVGGPAPHGFPPPEEPPPGDLRWSNSICALRLAYGTPAWCFQFLPRDVWGASGPSPPFLFEAEVETGRLPAVARFTGMGVLYAWERETGRLLGVSENYIPVPGPEGTPGRVNLLPGGIAGTVWSPGAYHPGLRLAYSVNRHFPGYFDRAARGDEEGRSGNVAAVDPGSGRVVWTYAAPAPMEGGVLATAGGLVFAGGPSATLDAWHARTGERLWSFRTGARCISAPMTYRLEGRQVVAAACGGHGILDPGGGDALIAFALP